MNTDFSFIIRLGFDEWFQKQENSSEPDVVITRVVTVNKNSYLVNDGQNEIAAEVSGKFLFETDSSLDFPAVGDFVFTRLYNDNTFGVIFKVLPRKSLLKRKSSGSKIEYQLIAANIDTAFIMQSLDSNFNLRRLERYLVIVKDSGIVPYVLLSKSDLISEEEKAKKIADIFKIMPGIKVSDFSNIKNSSVEEIKRILLPGKTYCLLGSSGVGKTTLINNLISKDLFKTSEIREKDGRGRHTTTSRHLIVLDNGVIFIDNPGMRELGVISAETGLDETFFEISELIKECRFNDCTHTIEKDCAVLKAIKDGTLSKERFNNYIKMQKESAYNEMSYYDKRQKDKKFGKLVRSILKEKNYKK